MSVRRRKLHYNAGDGTSMTPWRESLNRVIFGAETRTGKLFDVVLIVSIVFSVITVMLDSVSLFHERHAQFLYFMEWAFTLLFTLEYILRLLCVRRPWLYFCSFFGIVDLLSILPTYLSLFFPGSQYMTVIRILRLLRVFRILKLSEYMDEAQVLMVALHKSLRKITVFLYAVITLVIIFGAVMYVIEKSTPGFTSIPKAVYWAIVTLTTVGYGDIAPQTVPGQLLASAIMIMGYGIIAVPTGIYSAELVKSYKGARIRNDACPDCGKTGHDFDADYCKYCGHLLDEPE